MKASRLAASTLIALASLAAGSAFADSGTSFPEQAPSSLTRAQVQAEVLQARKDGTLNQQLEKSNHPDMRAQSAPSGLTRAEVLAEVLQARKDGTLNQQLENHNYPNVATQSAPSGKTRAEVQAEYLAARQAGLLPQDRS